MVWFKVPKNLQLHWVVSSLHDSHVFMNGREQGPRSFSGLWRSVMAYPGSALSFVVAGSL